MTLRLLTSRCGACAVLAFALLAGCGRESIDALELRDPAACAGCHPQHTLAWAGSMHAYASDDPVFVAMNRLGQRETAAALGTFCVRCHAPMAVAAGATDDGLDLDQLPRELRGVTCVACHQIEAVNAINDGDLSFVDDGSMRGGLHAPRSTPAHRSVRSSLLASVDPESSTACGACHDVVPRSGLAIEQTYAEWSGSLFARPEIGLSCAACHMIGSDAPAARDGPTRRVHDHTMAAVDVALTPWPGIDVQRRAIARDLSGALTTTLCVAAGGLEVTVTLDNTQAGHAFPSGTTHARRLWVELVAETGGVEHSITGTHRAGDVIHAGDAPSAWVLGSRFRDAAGGEVQLPWQAVTIESDLLAPSVTTDRSDPRFYHAKSRSWLVAGSPEKIRLAVHLQPIGLDVLDVLSGSGISQRACARRCRPSTSPTPGSSGRPHATGSGASTERSDHSGAVRLAVVSRARRSACAANSGNHEPSTPTAVTRCQSEHSVRSTVAEM